jgi:hypothetical protein
VPPARCRQARAVAADEYGAGVKWTVVATIEVPNFVPGEGAIEDSALGMAAVLESNRGAVQRQVTLVVEAPDEAEAERVAVEQLTSGLGASLSGVPSIASIRVEPDE